MHTSPLFAIEQRIVDLLCQWAEVLTTTGVAADRAERAARRSITHGSDFARELVICRAVDECRLFSAIAEQLGLRFRPSVDAKALIIHENQGRILLAGGFQGSQARFLLEDNRVAVAVARYDMDLSVWSRRLQRLPALKERLVIVPPSALRAALVARSRGWLLRDSVLRLRVSRPSNSAYDVASTWQSSLAGGTAILLPVSLTLAPLPTILTLNVCASIAFLACILIRLLALRTAAPLRLPSLPDADPASMPTYSVLVALHREREVVSQLLVALGRLQWPRSRLEIKLICEGDDDATLDALALHQLHPCIEVVRVPPALPRTKPKALAYALPLCSGEFVTLYDAEDRPHPMQLVEAWQRFARSSHTVACLQAPLTVTNHQHGGLARMFAFEYAGLFRGLLPWLAALGTVVPLGGTSNHFRGLM